MLQESAVLKTGARERDLALKKCHLRPANQSPPLLARVPLGFLVFNPALQQDSGSNKELHSNTPKSLLEQATLPQMAAKMLGLQSFHKLTKAFSTTSPNLSPLFWQMQEINILKSKNVWSADGYTSWHSGKGNKESKFIQTHKRSNSSWSMNYT